MSIDDKLSILKELSECDWSFGNLIIELNGNIYYGKNEGESHVYSDKQVANALSKIIGKNKPIDSKQKWAGAQWFLRWAANYPAKPQDFCKKIRGLPFEKTPEIMCDYNNIRAISTLSFMNEDPLHLESVKYSKNDESVFFQMREVVIALKQELHRLG